MTNNVRPILHICVLLVLAAALGCERSNKKPAAPTTAPATQPAPATTQAAQPPKPLGYCDVLRKVNPRAATQPLEFPLELVDAGHFVLKQPVYLDWRGDLWVTDPGAAPTAQALKTAADDQTHVVREQVVFAHWTVDAKGKSHPNLIAKAGDKVEWVNETGRKPIGANRKYIWERAQAWGDKLIVVPTDRGVAVFDISSEPIETYQELSPEPLGHEPVFVFEPNGLIAWIPWHSGKPGSDGPWRYSEKTWTKLADRANWPQKIVHLVPLLDGSVLQLSEGENGTLKISMSALGQTSVDENEIAKLVKQMSDPDAQKRQEAYNELTRYGNASWPVLEKLKDNQPLEARMRVEQLLENKTQPTLGGRTLVENKGRVVQRFADGGVLIHGEAGVSVPREGQAPLIVSPAWLSIRPGRAIELLEEVLTQDLDPEQHRVFAWSDEWIVSDGVKGPRRLEGNHLRQLLKDSEVRFAHFVGIDRRGRWLFRKSRDGAETLVLDSTVPDPTPKLPIWLLDIKKGKVGWEKNDWPVIKRPGAWFLNEYGWVGLDEKTNPIITTPPPIAVAAELPASAPATTRAATLPATTQAATQPANELILVDADGRRYYDGAKTLTVVEKSGKRIVWPLPASAAGSGEVHLVRAKDGMLFLFNAPGRVLRIKPTPEAAQPFELDATFTHRVPNVDHFTRVWLDPANRIIMTYDTHMAILFPEGRIPPPFQRLIPAMELEDQAP